MKRNSTLESVTILLFIGIVFASLPDFFGDHRDVSLVSQLSFLANDFFPMDFSVLPELMTAFWETIKIATLSTLFATLFSILVAVAGSQTTGMKYGRWLVTVALSFIRSIPSLIWAVICVALIGVSSRAGVVALTFYSVGYLGKFFIDILDQADPKVARWLSQNRANPWQVFQFGIWPQLKAHLMSQSIWMWEYNIRSASIIGYVGAGGLGLQLHIYQEYGYWNQFSVALLIIFLVVFALQLIANHIKDTSKVTR